MMLLNVLLVVTWWSLLIHQVQATENSPRIIIVGAGVSGIAAASRLLQNGFNNITILEAENRIGGRIYTREFGGYLVDVGGQWVYGEKDNVAFELAWPLGLIAHSLPTPTSKFFGSSDGAISNDIATNLMRLYFNAGDEAIPDEYANNSLGHYFKHKLDEYFDSHPEIKPEQRIPLTDMVDLFAMGMEAADTWYNVSTYSDCVTCEGDLNMNWKDKGYGTIIDILIKKIPNPAEELPVLNNTVLNTQVSQINYNGSGTAVKIVTANGNEFTADHVIVTTSIEILKADHKTMFNPQLPEVKINTMKDLHLGTVVKLFLVYDEPWWVEKNETFNSFLHLYWTEKDRNEMANDPEKSWMLGLSYLTGIAHKPRLLLGWITGPRARQMETVSEDRVFTQIKEILHRFFDRAYNLTEPTAMLRSQWYSNKHFRGTWSYQSPEFRNSGAKLTDLSDPLMKDGKPAVLFAGEITSAKHYGTVQGAIGSGWREADRLKKFYADSQ